MSAGPQTVEQAPGEPTPGEPAIREADIQSQERLEDELVMYLERDQYVAETSRPVPQAILSARAHAALWALRAFVVIVSLMVTYAFISQLH
jgi:hypothetical protein